MKKTGQAAVQRERRSRESSLVQQVGMQRAYCFEKAQRKSARGGRDKLLGGRNALSLLSTFSQAQYVRSVAVYPLASPETRLA